MPGSSLTDLLIEYYRRLDAGERPRLEEFRARAGAQWGELVDLVRVEDAFKAAIREDPSLADYTIVDVVGEGAHGTVYEAIQQPLGRRVAVKVMRLGWTGKDDFRERFERAARAAAAVEHPHAVRIYDGGVDRDRAFLAMSLVRGPSLRELLERLRAVEDAPFGTGHHHVLDAARVPSGRAGVRGYVQRIAALLAGPADALAAYHGCSIVHRDVKPSNLLLGGDGRLRIADFDLMKDLSSSFQTQPWTPMGTPHYMAPEQWSGDSVGKAADVYGLGAVFWECLTLRAPFADAERDMLKDMALHTRPQDPASVVAGVPRDAAGVALKALEKQPRDRYADAHALADDLRRLAAD
ncbi:MAG: serine/threonine protein kinase, partial [Planctomycetota bacterium]|nr:serine/threonine protein kinase [Planctomycetota bacterium]